jgi:hypothetical protein
LVTGEVLVLGWPLTTFWAVTRVLGTCFVSPVLVGFSGDGGGSLRGVGVVPFGDVVEPLCEPPLPCTIPSRGSVVAVDPIGVVPVVFVEPVEPVGDVPDGCGVPDGWVVPDGLAVPVDGGVGGVPVV